VKAPVLPVPAYYFEISPKKQSLVYHLPRKHLIELIRSGKVKSSALFEFQHGLQTLVNHECYRQIEEDYWFKPPLNPNLLFKAFKGFQIYSRPKSISFGFIAAHYLEEYAIHVQNLDLKDNPPKYACQSLTIDQQRWCILKAKKSWENVTS